MANGEAVDVVDDAGEKAFFGVLAIASAALTARAVSPATRAFAQAVVEEGGQEINRLRARAPAEAGLLATEFNRDMDAILDAANDSHRIPFRVTRRTMLAEALERAGLCLIDKGTLAAMFCDRLELQLARERFFVSAGAPAADPEGDGFVTVHATGCACAAELAAAGGAEHFDYMEGGGPEQPASTLND